MKKVEKEFTYYFVDESGDPIFYNSNGNNIVGKGASKFLMLGFIETEAPKVIRGGLKKLHNKICSNQYYHGVPFFEKSTKRFFHAKDDIPEIRKEVFELISTLNFKAHFVFARKHENIFNGKIVNGKPESFYSHLIKQLFKNRLHLSENTYICFEKRGNKQKQGNYSGGTCEYIQMFYPI